MANLRSARRKLTTLLLTGREWLDVVSLLFKIHQLAAELPDRQPIGQLKKCPQQADNIVFNGKT